MIKLLPESEGNLIAIQVSGRLTGDDYDREWAPRLREAIEQHGQVRVLVYLDETFEGWEASAIWEETKFGLQNMAGIEKAAIVGGPDWVGKLAELFGNVIPGEYKSFETGDLEEAFAWVK
ncbi:MAG: STAS/SEC14 domain-containing protein [Myxococcota bacterium]|nr:STAS/SEC14 domain-containing protein [Myxococcota bacterium]